jgi:hypothetical protein
MGERLLLVDSDVFIILSAAGYLERAICLLGFRFEAARRLPALESQLIRGAAFRDRYPDAVRHEALKCCGMVASLTERPDDSSVLDSLALVSDIDEGEAVMYALLKEQPSWLLVSGDKRAMCALAATPELSAVHNALTGRIICLEALIRKLVERDGIQPVAKAFAPLGAISKTLSVVFSKGETTSLADCMKALDDYLRDLTKQVGAGFLLTP